MATKSFLTPEELDLARKILAPPAAVPEGDEKHEVFFTCFDFSRWLSLHLEARFKDHPSWVAAGPLAVGSWARGELCPSSDIDLLFCGDESAVATLVRDFNEQGLKIRARVPEDLEDWTVGVQAFDVLAILHGKPFTPLAAEKLVEQQRRIREQKRTKMRSLLQAMVGERQARTERFDSISNYLEPNLKFGSGGLRDLQQAVHVYELFPEKFAGSTEAQHALKVLNYYKAFFLTIRQKLHLNGASDTLIAPEQPVLSQWFGYKHHSNFMREVQKGLSRVSFYADWIVEQARSPSRRIEDVQKRRLTTVDDFFKALQDDPSVLMQSRVRQEAGPVFRKIARAGNKAVRAKIGRRLFDFLRADASDEATKAFFRACMMDRCVPEFKRLVGLVQHDQYHRYTADAHILQAVRELKRIRRKPKALGRLAPVVAKFSALDWQILAWTCLYHDIAKGRGGDHSRQGQEMARRDLAAFGLPSRVIQETAWMVENHLAMSEAAFRRNPRSPKTWQELHDKGVEGARIGRLAVFTALDIRATNPEAWTPWKAQLLSDLVGVLTSKQTGLFMELLGRARRERVEIGPAFLQALDPFLVEGVPGRVLIEDYRELNSSGDSLEPRVVRSQGGEIWVRFHDRQDRPGLFLEYVTRLYHAGCRIRHASVQTLPDIGAYDWFEVRSSREPAQLRKLLLLEPPEKSPPEVRFDQIQVVSADEEEWIISFRGRDQSGALIRVVQTLFDENLQVRWAKVHTWGRQLDDIFSVCPSSEGLEPLLERLRARLTTSGLP